MLEQKLTSGGWGENGHSRTELFGAEIITPRDANACLQLDDATLENEEWMRKVAIEAQSRGISEFSIQLVTPCTAAQYATV